MDDQNKSTIQQQAPPPSGVATLFSEPPKTPLHNGLQPNASNYPVTQSVSATTYPTANLDAIPAEEPLINQPGFSSAGQPPKRPAAEPLDHQMHKPSLKMWAGAVALVLILAGATLYVINRPKATPQVSSQQTATGTNNQQLGSIGTESVTFGINTKIANGKTLTATGPVIVQNAADSLAAFKIQNAAGDNLFVADTQNGRVGIGASPTGAARLQISGDVSATGNVSANGSVLSSGDVSAAGGAVTISGRGLTINSVLICTSAGCKSSAPVFNGGATTLNGHTSGFFTNASNLTTGTLGDSLLSTNVALLDANQTYSGINSFTAAGNTFVGDGSGLSSVNALQLGGQGSSYYTNASNLGTGTLSDNRLSANITKRGNTFNGLSELVMLDSSGLLPVLDASALTNLNAAAISIGTISDSRLSTNVTLLGNNFNGANQLVKLNNSGDLPVLSGINLTNLNASSASTGTLNDLRLSSNVTLQGNTFNGASQLIRATAQSYFPALNGSLISNIAAGNIASGTLDNNRLSANVALLTASSQTFSGTNTFSNIISAPGLETTNSGHVIAVGFSGVTTGNLNYNFDNTATPGTYTICTTAGNCSGPSGGVTTTGGTSNQLTKFSGADTITNSIISDDGSTVTIAGDLAANNITQNSNEICDVSGNCAGVGGQVGGTGTLNKVALFSGTSTVGDSIISQSGTVIGVGGDLNITGQYKLNGTQVSSAVLSDAADIAMLDSSQIFSGNNTFTGAIQVQPASDSTTALLVTNHAGDNNVLTVDTTNGRIGINTQPGYAFDVNGDINVSSGSAFRINGVAICGPSATCAPASGSSSYIQNTVSQQGNANINIQSVNSGSIVANFEGASGQTADLIRAQDGGGVNVFHVDPSGNVNIAGQYQINGSPICTTGGCTAAGGSGSYIQNGGTPQTATFNITGNGTIGGNATVNGDALFKQSSGSGNAFQIQDQSGSNLLNLNTISSVLDADSSTISIGTTNGQHSINIGNGGVGTFPENGVLDNFNRTNNATLGSSWSGPIDPSDSSTWQVNSDQALDNHFGSATDNYRTDISAANLEAYFTIVSTTGEYDVWARVQNPNTSTSSGYILDWDGSTNTLQLYKSVNNSYSTIGPAITVSQAAGSQMAITTVGSIITGYANTGSGWVQEMQVSDSSITGAGTIGIMASAQSDRIDDFGGGPASGTSEAITIGSTNSASSLVLQGGAGNVLISSAASTVIKPTTDSTTAFQIQNAGSGAVFNVDTTTGNIGIGKTGASQKLDVNGSIRVAAGNFISWGASDDIKIQDAGSNTLNFYTAGTLQTSIDASGNFTLSGNGLLVMGIKTSDPTCTNGATYYNSISNTFRGCANGSWNDFSLGGAIPTGTISTYAGSSAPVGYLMADGSAVSRTTYAALFTLIGTTYGSGNGSTTFNLPDLRGRVSVGLGTNSDVSSLGETDGSALASRTPRHNSTYNAPTLSRSADVILNDPGHSHSIYNFFGGGVTQNGALCGCNNGGGTTSTNSSFTGITVSQQPNFTLSGGSVGPGGSRPTDTPAYITLNYIIKY